VILDHHPTTTIDRRTLAAATIQNKTMDDDPHSGMEHQGFLASILASGHS
jgi:hypothetical protein